MSEVKALFRAYYVMNLMFLPVVLGVVALWILSEQPPPGWAIAAYVMLALAAGILYLLRRALARIGASAMTINADGIDHWTWDFIPWSDIEDVELLRATPGFTFTYFLTVRLRDSAPYLSRVGGIERWLRTKSLSTTTGSIDLLISGLSPGPEDLCAVAVALLEQSRQR
jgi:hypothetical protein